MPFLLFQRGGICGISAATEVPRCCCLRSHRRSQETARHAADGKQLALPRVDRATRRLAIHAVADMVNDVQAGVWGIREPRAEQPLVALETIDFVLLPGVGFTPRGARLGYGGGFYDRLLEHFAQRPPLVAAAYAVQIRAQLPLHKHDRGVDLVVTEEMAYCYC